MTAHVEPATRAYAEALVPKLRQADRDEVWASHHATPYIATLGSFLSTPECSAIVDGDDVIALFGVMPGSSVLRTGIPWLLGSDEITGIAREFLRQSRPVIRGYFNKYRTLENFVSVDNRISVRWLRWCGFRMGAALPYGPDEALFYHFHARREDI